MNIMEHTPTLSIIIPVYNVKEYVRDCLQSVIRQTYKDYEVILVDDGSTDDSGAICDEVAASDCRLRVIHQCNQGQAGARNTGLDHARGRFVTFVDSDDEYGTDTVLGDNMTLMLGDERLDMVQFPSDREWEIRQPAGGTATYEGTSAILKNFRRDVLDGMLWNKIYRRELLQGVRFTTMTFEDAWFMADVVPLCHKIVRSPYGYYKYRIRMGSVSHVPISIRMNRDMLALHLKFQKQIESLQSDPEAYVTRYNLLIYLLFSAVRADGMAAYADYLPTVQALCPSIKGILRGKPTLQRGLKLSLVRLLGVKSLLRIALGLRKFKK